MLLQRMSTVSSHPRVQKLIQVFGSPHAVFADKIGLGSLKGRATLANQASLFGTRHRQGSHVCRFWDLMTDSSNAESRVA